MDKRKVIKRVILVVLCVAILSLLLLYVLHKKPWQWTSVNVDATGTFVYADGTTESVSFAIDGQVNDTSDDLDELYITFKLSDNFRYLITTPEPFFVSMNQKYNDFSHLMICPAYIYNKPGNRSVFSYFALDLEAKCVIVLFGDAPDCYLVAAQDGTQSYDQLLAHFADFVEAYGPRAWGN